MKDHRPIPSTVNASMETENLGTLEAIQDLFHAPMVPSTNDATPT